MRDIYPRKLSEKSLISGGIAGGRVGEALRSDAAASCNATSQRRTSMSNSMTFVRGNSMSTSISSLFSDNENESESARQRVGSSSSSQVPPLPIRINNTLKNALMTMFQCKTEETLSPTTKTIKTPTKTNMSTSLTDRTFSEAYEDAGYNIKCPSNGKTEEGFDRPTQLLIPGNAALDTSNHANRCPLCLDNLSSADLAHPPQCSTSECTFNFCLKCAESYIASSKDPYQKASDGSHQLKIFLRCPSCRSDLSTTLRDTVLLRHSDTVANDSDDEIKLTPSDLSLQHAMSGDPFIQAAVDIAKEREETFFRDGIVECSPCSAAKAFNPPSQDNVTSQKRHHSFFYGLIEEAKQAREKKKAIDANRRHTHNRRHSVV